MSILTLLIAAGSIGAWCRSRLALEDPLESVCLCMLCGLAPVAVLVLVAGAVSLAGAQYAVAAIAAACIVWQLLPGSRRAPGRAPWGLRDLNILERASLMALVAAGLLALISALAPVTQWDAAVAHLALPAAYAREGRIVLDPGNVYSGYPQFMHGLYAVAFYGGSGGHEILVSLLNWLFACLSCLAVYSLGKRTGTRQTGLVAAALLATAPIFMDQAGGAGIDLPFAAFSTAALAALVAWIDTRNGAWLVAAGLLAGSSCGIRHTGYLVCLLLAAGVFIGGLRTSPLRALACYGSVALLAAAPWFLRSWLLLGNPVFPFLLAWFPEAPIDHIAISAPGAHESIARTEGIGLLALLRFPWDIVMRPHLYDGWNKSPGGLILILGVPGLLLGGARAWGLGAFSVAGGTAFFFFQRLARYLLPFFTPMMVVAALAVETLPRGRRLVVGLLLFSFAYGLTLHAAAMHFKVKVVLGLQTRAEYLEQRVERYAAFQYANAHCTGGGKLLTVDQRSYYLEMPSFQNHWSLQRIAALPLIAQVDWLRRQGIGYVMIPHDFIAQSGALSGDVATMLAAWQRQPRWFSPLGAPLVLPAPKRRRGRGGVVLCGAMTVRFTVLIGYRHPLHGNHVTLARRRRRRRGRRCRFMQCDDFGCDGSHRVQAPAPRESCNACAAKAAEAREEVSFHAVR